MSVIPKFLLILPFMGCTQIFGPDVLAPGADTIRPMARPGDGFEQPSENARTVEEFDTTNADDRAAALVTEAGAGETRLGRTIASLGDPTKPGFWLETPLVGEPGTGRVEHTETGKSVKVQLIPSGGARTAGSRVSLAAIRLLGVPLTGLPELVVFRAP